MLHNYNEITYANIEFANQQEFLEMFPYNRRSWVATKFYKAARNGYSTPDTIIEVVLKQVAQKIQTSTKERALLATISENYNLALKYAQFVIAWNNLSSN